MPRYLHIRSPSDTQKKVHQGWGGDRGDTEYKAETQGAADASKESGDTWGAGGGAGGGDTWGAGGGAGGGTTGGWDSGAPATTGGEAEAWGPPAPAENAEVGWGNSDAKDGDAKEGDAKSPDDEGKPKKRYDDDEDDNKITLDEYLKKKAPIETVPKLELRTVDNDAFKDAVALKKDADEDNYFVGKVSRPSS